jgi:carbon-monoxide dehydrogenase large subunit
MRTVENGIGQPVRRKEDWRLLTGRGCYVDDLTPANLAHAVIVRSPHAHARLVAIDTSVAHAAPGVLAVLTGADYLADGLGPIPHRAGLMRPPDLEARPRSIPANATDHYPLASDRARFVGEPVAVIVAKTIAQAKDASELLEINYEELTPVVRAVDALKPGAPRLWDDPPGNLRIDIEAGDAVATAAAFARATHVVRLDTWIQRVTARCSHQSNEPSWRANSIRPT